MYTDKIIIYKRRIKMPVNPEKWYQEQVDKGLLPDENGYYHWTYSKEIAELYDTMAEFGMAPTC